MKRQTIIRICIVASFIVLGLYAFKGAILGHPVPVYLLVAPTVSIFSGLIYLRRTSR